MFPLVVLLGDLVISLGSKLIIKLHFLVVVIQVSNAYTWGIYLKLKEPFFNGKLIPTLNSLKSGMSA